MYFAQVDVSNQGRCDGYAVELTSRKARKSELYEYASPVAPRWWFGVRRARESGVRGGKLAVGKHVGCTFSIGRGMHFLGVNALVKNALLGAET